MCGRFTLTRRELGDVAAYLDAEVDDALQGAYRPRYNIAPTDVHLILREPHRLEPGIWGWAGGPAGLVINARSETVAKKAMFREAVARRRCVIPADGFYEWTGDKSRRRPLWFHPPDGGLLLMAGLWEPAPDGRPAFTVLTTEANALIAASHDRMPVLLDRETARQWLLRPNLDLLCPAAVGSLVCTPVSPRVNSVENDDPACLEPEGPEPPPRQLRLF